MKISDISYYLFESYKDAVEKFSQEEDKETVNQYLDSFKQLAKKGIVTGQEKDIGYWIKQGWPDFKEFVDNKSQEKTQSQAKKSKKKDAIIVHDDEEKMAVIPLTKDSSCFYGKGTEWCTSATKSKNHFENYFYLENIVLVYIFIKKTGSKFAAAIHIDGDEVDDISFFNENDKSISIHEFAKVTGINFEQLEQFYEEHKNSIVKAKDINNIDEELQITILNSYPRRFKNIKEPSLRVQIAAVSALPNLIQFISDPSEEVQKTAVKNEPYAIKLINNPSKYIQYISVVGEGVAIQFINNPSEEIQLAAVEEDAMAIRFIDNPTEKVQLEAIHNNYDAIQYIDDPTENVQLAVINYSSFNIRYIENPSEEIKLKAVEKRGLAIRYLDNPSEKLQLAAIRNSGDAIKFIENPTEKSKELHKEIWWND